MRSIGLGDALAPINVFMVKDPDPILISEEAWQDLECEVALDPGSLVRVSSIDDIPGYRLGDSPGSTRGQELLMGDGGTIPNLGQSQLNWSDTGVGRDFKSVFHIDTVTRPLK